MYTITRQRQWPDGDNVVEISSGGLDYCNPDALVQKYDGEFEQYDDPREAVEIAIEICRAWRADGCKGAVVGTGSTGGTTMPFDGTTFKAAIAWAQAKYDRLEKCPTCEAVVADLTERYLAGTYTESDFIPYDDGFKYCSESCAEKTSDHSVQELVEQTES